MEFGRFRGKFSGNQWNSVGFRMALNINSVGILGGFRGSVEFLAKIRDWDNSGQLGPQKALRKQTQHTLWVFKQSLTLILLQKYRQNRCPAEVRSEILRTARFPGFGCPKRKISQIFTAKNGVKNGKFHANFTLLGGGGGGAEYRDLRNTRENAPTSNIGQKYPTNIEDRIFLYIFGLF